MEIIIVLSIIVIIILIILLAINKNKLKDILNKNKNLLSEREDYKSKLLQEIYNENGSSINQLELNLNLKKNELTFIEQSISNAQTTLNSLKNTKEEDLNQIFQEKELRLTQQFNYKKSQLEEDIEEWAKSNQEAISFQCKQLEKEIEDLELTKISIENEINDMRKLQNAANQEILRRRAIEENQEFYRIQLDQTSLKDFHIINSIRSQLTKIDIIDKLLYDNYIKKPTDEMIKRVLQGRAPSGIYKITRLKTGEVYIGKSVDVKSRWQQHTKSAFHCGTISHSILHSTMERDGIENFTWELLEEVSKDNLNEREKYWINFYGSKQYGLNEKD